MLKLRTTKEVQISIHSDETALVEFRYTYARVFLKNGEDGVHVLCEAFKISEIEVPTGPPSPDGTPAPKETVERFDLIQGGGDNPIIVGEQLEQLQQMAVPLTPELSDDSKTMVEKFDALVRTGIKLWIAQNGLWKNQLSMDDFEE